MATPRRVQNKPSFKICDHSVTTAQNQPRQFFKIIAKSLILMVGDTGIEPVTPTMSM